MWCVFVPIDIFTLLLAQYLNLVIVWNIFTYAPHEKVVKHEK